MSEFYPMARRSANASKWIQPLTLPSGPKPFPLPPQPPLPSGERARVRGRPVHEPLARAILEEGIEREFDLAYSQDIRLGLESPESCPPLAPVVSSV
jgi:hypothetical protein